MNGSRKGDPSRLGAKEKKHTSQNAHTIEFFFDLWVLLHSEVAKKLELPTPYASHADAARSGRDGARFREGERESECGIPETDIPRLTQRFYRVDKARSRELGGTGLGLAIVKHIVLAHGGRLQIESQLDRGTTIRVTLPFTSPTLYV